MVETVNPQQALTRRILEMTESQTIQMAKKARELAAKGVDVINLSFGEPDFQTPQYIKDGAKQAIDEGFTFYTPVAGTPDLRKAISAKLAKDNGLNYPPEQIVVSTGAKQSIANAVMCLVEEGDEVIILAPYWVSYLEIVKMAGGKPVIVSGSIENDFVPEMADIKAAVNERTKLIMYSSPCNPTGTVFCKAFLAELAMLMEANSRIYAIADEIYEFINFGEPMVSLATFGQVADRVVTVNGFSKGFAMTGWRVGYIAAAKLIADSCDKIQGQFTSGTCSIAQRAATTALTGDMSPTFEMRDHFKRRRDLVLGMMADIKGLKFNTPTGAFYVFPDVSYYLGKKTESGQVMNNVHELCMYLLNDAHVSTVPGDAFGDDRCIRISYAAADEKLVSALTRIKESLYKLV